MKVIHRSEQLLVLEDQPWLIGILMIVMVVVFLFGSMAMLAAGQWLGAIIMGLVGVGVPVLIGALMVQRVRLTFDRNAGQLTRTVRSVRGLSRESFAIERLDRAEVSVSSDSDGSTYRTELRLRAPAEVVPFTSYHTSGSKPQQMANAVNEWLSGTSASSASRPDHANR